MERIIVDNVSKDFQKVFKRNKNILFRLLSFISGKEDKKKLELLLLYSNPENNKNIKDKISRREELYQQDLKIMRTEKLMNGLKKLRKSYALMYNKLKKSLKENIKQVVGKK